MQKLKDVTCPLDLNALELFDFYNRVWKWILENDHTFDLYCHLRNETDQYAALDDLNEYHKEDMNNLHHFLECFKHSVKEEFIMGNLGRMENGYIGYLDEDEDEERTVVLVSKPVKLRSEIQYFDYSQCILEQNEEGEKNDNKI